ncbi:uracil-DNA glycosylase [Paenibacillus sedimenti]|uniref:Uracil-DNA glycosylase n=1 Tax=Paenibacillus sedimenti TaxID=2770274 RepID=A0A926QLZ1_9BACL|nr:uracil-DNA glycosylase [Paenibacillus sedimenti]MBD0383082.1 uracil-DNA glycosylase [Paenibacillus sedimenti]
MKIFTNDWSTLLEEELQKPYYLELHQFLVNEYHTKAIFPEKHDIFNAFHLTAYADTKVVILGQDPYHGRGQAHGLSFSVKPGIPAPPSLQNMYKELQTDLGCYIPNNGYLVSWAQQGVLMLNTVLTVREDKPNSHKDKGWEQFTNAIIQTLNQREQPIVFLLWGSHAQAKQKLIDTGKHRIIKSPHPSPLSAYRGFFGSKPFSRANQYLAEFGSTPIDWQIPNIPG